MEHGDHKQMKLKQNEQKIYMTLETGHLPEYRIFFFMIK